MNEDNDKIISVHMIRLNKNYEETLEWLINMYSVDIKNHSKRWDKSGYTTKELLTTRITFFKSRQRNNIITKFLDDNK